jgi:hypothetical protein
MIKFLRERERVDEAGSADDAIKQSGKEVIIFSVFYIFGQNFVFLLFLIFFGIRKWE